MAFPARPSPGAEPVGWLTMPASGEPFPFKNRPKDLALKGGKDGWAFVCTPEQWEAAETVVRVEGIGDALALAPLLPDGRAVASNIAGAGSKRVPVEPFEGKSVLVIGDADDPGVKGAAAFADRVSKVAARVAVVVLPYKVTPTGGKDVRDLLNDADDPAAAVSELLASASWSEIADQRGPECGGRGGGRPPSNGTRMVELTDDADAELFHDSEREPHITFTQEGRRETHRLRTQAVRDWLSMRLYSSEGVAPGSEATESALNVLAARAKFEGACRPVAVRVAPHPEGVVLDLGGPDWRGVLVTADGWETVSLADFGDDFPTRFVRPKGLLPLPEPERGGSLAELRPLVNVASDGDFALLLAWLTATLMTDGPFPLLILNGEQGSAKSTTAKVLRQIVDPNRADLRRPPKCTTDLVIAATNAHVVALENLSAVKADMSDDLCCLSTGAGFSTRSLYTNGEEALYSFRRPVLLNGIPTLSDRPDLLDRAVVLTLPVIAPGDRKAERAFWPAFEAARPRLLGALLDAVATALRNLPDVRLDEPPRMADFATFAVAAEPAFPVAPGTFLTAYADARESAHEAALEGEVIAAPARELVERGGWEGTATALLEVLGRLAGDAVVRGREWPKLPNQLSGRLRRITPDLRAAGVRVEFVDAARPKQIKLGLHESVSRAGTPNPGAGRQRTDGIDRTDEAAAVVPFPVDPPSARRQDRRRIDDADCRESRGVVDAVDADGPSTDLSGDGDETGEPEADGGEDRS